MEKVTITKREGSAYWSASDGFTYTRSKSGVFSIVLTAYAEKSKWKRILEIIKEK